MKGQHELLWKPEEKSGDPEGKALPAPQAASTMIFPMSHSLHACKSSLKVYSFHVSICVSVLMWIMFTYWLCITIQIG